MKYDFHCKKLEIIQNRLKLLFEAGIAPDFAENPKDASVLTGICLNSFGLIHIPKVMTLNITISASVHNTEQERISIDFSYIFWQSPASIDI